MNVFFAFDEGSLQTPPLSGTILPGITRESLITLARDMGLTVREERYAIDQWQEDASSARLREAFACGTAAVVAPFGEAKGRNTASPSETSAPARSPSASNPHSPIFSSGAAQTPMAGSIVCLDAIARTSRT